MRKAYIKAIEYYVPLDYEENDPNDKLTKKIGIARRNISGKDEFASDLAIEAAELIFNNNEVSKDDIDFLIYCTQSPDYILPTTACLIQDRLGLPSSCGAFDYNLGCSGYVYGLSIAKGLIETGSAKNILLITADTYSKYINPNDRSVRVLFGDAATASIISSKESTKDLIGPFVFGTDGSGKDNLIVHAGGLKEPLSEESTVEKIDAYGNTRSRSNLYMNGSEVFNFTLNAVPKAYYDLIEKSEVSEDQYSKFIFHQANKFMLNHLRAKLKIDEDKFSVHMEHFGNTVSSTIPIALKNELNDGNLENNDIVMLLGFGVGYSWAACNIIWDY
jgi:3-oxoacyl-[acyl-carrier-protein] synthase-3